MRTAHESLASYGQRKDALRHSARAARRTRSAAECTHAEQAIARGLLDALPAGTVACYVSVPGEPPTGALLDALLARGTRVLLPVVTAAGTLDWAVHTGADALAEGRWGLREPSGPRLGPAALSEADAIVVPALLVDRRGCRLGQGGGYYDRALVHARAGVPVLAVVYDDEVVDAVPREPHDRFVTAIATPGGVLAVTPADR